MQQPTYSWKQGDFQKPTTKFPNGEYSRYADFTPLQLYELFLDEEIIDLMRTETEKYALFLNYENPNITASDLKAFLGILLLSGYNNLPGKILYWDSLHDMRIQMVYETMRRERFSTIMRFRFIHFADNNCAPGRQNVEAETIDN